MFDLELSAVTPRSINKLFFDTFRFEIEISIKKPTILIEVFTAFPLSFCTCHVMIFMCQNFFYFILLLIKNTLSIMHYITLNDDNLCHDGFQIDPIHHLSVILPFKAV